MNIKELAQAVLRNGYLMSLGVADADGPWVSDVIYVYDESFNIYWVSMPDTRHSKAVESSGKAACTITASEKVGDERGLQIEGTVRRIEGPMFELEKQHRAKRGLQAPTRPGEMIDDGHVWYQLTPTRIELLHTKDFGYERQRVL